MTRSCQLATGRWSLPARARTRSAVSQNGRPRTTTGSASRSATTAAPSARPNRIIGLSEERVDADGIRGLVLRVQRGDQEQERHEREGPGVVRSGGPGQKRPPAAAGPRRLSVVLAAVGTPGKRPAGLPERVAGRRPSEAKRRTRGADGDEDNPVAER